jgi:predicted dehydrogenase
LKQFQEIAPYGKPVFIDKPMATSVVEARAIANLAKEHNIPLMTSSILRYGQPLIDALESGEKLIGADCSGPMDLEETQPGLFWYGIHTVEMLYAALGGGCEHVTAFTTADSEFVRGVWKDGRVGTIRGSRGGSKQYCALLHGENSSRAVDVLNYPKPAYAGLLEQVLTMFQTGKAPIDIEESLEIMRFIEAANESRQSGARVSL